MTEPSVMEALIACIQAVMVAGLGVLGVWVAQAKRSAKNAEEQVSNNHDTNLREENDERHQETMRRFDRLDSRVTLMSGRISTLESFHLKGNDSD